MQQRFPRPDFLVIGAAKSGTTSLWNYLGQHPRIFMAREKETHHFLFPESPPRFTGPGDDQAFAPMIVSDARRYAECFDRAGDAQTVGEASVFYLYRPVAIERALAQDPRMKLIAILRQPVDRAFSAWAHQRRDGWEPLDFSAAVAAESERIERGWSYGFHYESVGRYGAQLARVRELVPPSQLRVVLYDDLVRDPDALLTDLFEFLEVGPHAVDAGLVMNASGRPRVRGLNSMLTRPNPVKAGLKRVLPYNARVNLAQRVRNWNLHDLTLDAALRASMIARYVDDRPLLEEQVGVCLDHWYECN